MKIRTKLNAGIWLSSLAAVALSVYIMMELFRVAEVVQENILIDNVTEQMLALHFLTYDYIQRPLERKEGQWIQTYESLKKSLEKTQSSTSNGPLIPAEAVETYTNIRSMFTQLSEKLKSLSSAGAKVQRLADDIQERLAFLLITKNQEVYDWIMHASRKSNEQLVATIRRDTVVFLALLAGLALSISALLRLVSRGLFKSLLDLHLGVEAIARNDFKYRVPVVSDDELGELSCTFDKMTDELQRLYGTLQESENRYRAFFEQGPDGVVVLNPDSGEIVEFNDQACRQLGYSREEFAQLRVSDVRPSETTEMRAGRLQKVKMEGRDDFETVHINRQGAPRYVHVTVQSIDTSGAPIYHCIWRDITERRQAEEEHDRLHSQLLQAQKMESVGRLAGGVAHDFNNMLQVIMSHAEIALERVEPSQPLHAHLNEIQNAARRSAELTRQLLAFARKQTVCPQVLDLNAAVEGTLKMLRRLIGEDIELVWNPSGNVGNTKIDPSQIDQILANLCVNARDAIKGVGRVTIETNRVVFDHSYCADHAGFVPGEYSMIAVSDNGCGMSKETLDHMFEPFYTTKSMGEGTGLGLATVYGIVKQNDGFINAYSEPGLGTTFKIYFPRCAGAPAQVPKEELPPPTAKDHETVLIVEDELTILRLGEQMLQGLGYNVLAARTPSSAIQMAKQTSKRINVLLTDVVMPEMNGKELATQLIPLIPNLKCIFMSGYTSNVIAHHGVLEEGLVFIQKPFSTRDLATKVRQALDEP